MAEEEKVRKMADLTESEKKMIRARAEQLTYSRVAPTLEEFRRRLPSRPDWQADVERLFYALSELLLAMKWKAAQIAKEDESVSDFIIAERIADAIRNADFGDLFKEKV